MSVKEIRKQIEYNNTCNTLLPHIANDITALKEYEYIQGKISGIDEALFYLQQTFDQEPRFKDLQED